MCHAVLQSSDDVDAATHVVDVTYDDGFEGEFCSARLPTQESSCFTEHS